VHWCETCERFRDPSELGAHGECPGCGKVVVVRRRMAWHFKLLALATAIYLAYRIAQGVLWLVHHA
jgi:uncharacterized paraquat-inducible protein A